MNVICHQYVGMYFARADLRIFREAFEIEKVVLLMKEAGLAIVSALNQVQWNAW